MERPTGTRSADTNPDPARPANASPIFSRIPRSNVSDAHREEEILILMSLAHGPPLVSTQPVGRPVCVTGRGIPSARRSARHTIFLPETPWQELSRNTSASVFVQLTSLDFEKMSDRGMWLSRRRSPTSDRRFDRTCGRTATASRHCADVWPRSPPAPTAPQPRPYPQSGQKPDSRPPRDDH